MKSLANIFDSIRVKPTKVAAKRSKTGGSSGSATCEWTDCLNPAIHRAPKGRDHEGEYFRFCLKHVREYNKSYNYFSGLKSDDISSYQKNCTTGHRPTWRSANLGSVTEERLLRSGYKIGGNAFEERILAAKGVNRQVIRARERGALHLMGLTESATPSQIKARYKVLIKKHHPDTIVMNGDERQIASSQERLRAIIRAYKTLHKAGIVGG